ncbi:hypothetical protein [Desulfatirhabdium butyrativorans]|uniref:hypothetical protein n=1 Tax=Desulfatirhabdium butyrativorans TaxID=340467 RepID=UPI0012EC20E4|nr:hypothetical protein [Desulfatirhabdium butyrativorans]
MKKIRLTASWHFEMIASHQACNMMRYRENAALPLPCGAFETNFHDKMIMARGAAPGDENTIQPSLKRLRIVIPAKAGIQIDAGGNWTAS